MNQSLNLKLSSPRSNGISAQVEELRNAQRRQRLAPDIQACIALLGEDDLESANPHTPCSRRRRSNR